MTTNWNKAELLLFVFIISVLFDTCERSECAAHLIGNKRKTFTLINIELLLKRSVSFNYSKGDEAFNAHSYIDR